MKNTEVTSFWQRAANHPRLLLALAAVLIAAGVAIWVAARPDDVRRFRFPFNSATNTPDVTKVKSLVSYTVPAGWVEVDCGNGNLVYLLPSEQSQQGCALSSNPEWLISMSVKDQYTDCNQIKPTQPHKRHVCRSVFIDGHKTLQTSTEYLENVNEAAKTVTNYYVNTGKSVVRAQYVYHNDGSHLPAFEETANSIKVVR
jgi:hypothetical protein